MSPRGRNARNRQYKKWQWVQRTGQPNSIERQTLSRQFLKRDVRYSFLRNAGQKVPGDQLRASSLLYAVADSGFLCGTRAPLSSEESSARRKVRVSFP